MKIEDWYKSNRERALELLRKSFEIDASLKSRVFHIMAIEGFDKNGERLLGFVPQSPIANWEQLLPVPERDTLGEVEAVDSDMDFP